MYMYFHFKKTTMHAVVVCNMHKYIIYAHPPFRKLVCHTSLRCEGTVAVPPYGSLATIAATESSIGRYCSWAVSRGSQKCKNAALNVQDETLVTLWRHNLYTTATLRNPPLTLLLLHAVEPLASCIQQCPPQVTYRSYVGLSFSKPPPPSHALPSCKYLHKTTTHTFDRHDKVFDGRSTVRAFCGA